MAMETSIWGWKNTEKNPGDVWASTENHSCLKENWLPTPYLAKSMLVGRIEDATPVEFQHLEKQRGRTKEGFYQKCHSVWASNSTPHIPHSHFVGWLVKVRWQDVKKKHPHPIHLTHLSCWRSHSECAKNEKRLSMTIYDLGVSSNSN